MEDYYLIDIDSVPWPMLEGAYGSSEFIPSLLTSLVNPPEDISALMQLYDQVCHCGTTIYPVSSHTIPFLFQTASFPTCEIRSRVVTLIGRMVRGGDMDSDEDRTCRINCICAAAKRWSEFSSLLSDEDSAMQLSAIYLASGILKGANELEINLDTMPSSSTVAETFADMFTAASNEVVKAATIFAIAEIAPAQFATEFLVASRNSSVTVSFACNFCLSNMLKFKDNETIESISKYFEKSNEVLAFLGGRIGDDYETEAVFPWFEFIDELVLDNLLREDMREEPVILQRFEEVIGNSDRMFANLNVEPIVESFFAEGALSDGTDASTFSKPQRRILHAILNNAGLWDLDSKDAVTFPMHLGIHGGKEGRDYLRGLLGISPENG